MKLVALELSTKMGSIAFIDSGEIIKECTWEEKFENRQQLFDALQSLQLDWDSIDGYVVGRGPGSFSGLRISFSVINTLASPGKNKVFSHNSCSALALRYFSDHTVVVGDARRNQLWIGEFDGVSLIKKFELISYDQLNKFILKNTIVVSPDQDRLKDLLTPYQQPIHQNPVYPTAGELGKIVYENILNNKDFEPFEPLYLHPPVFIEPKFK